MSNGNQCGKPMWKIPANWRQLAAISGASTPSLGPTRKTVRLRLLEVRARREILNAVSVTVTVLRSIRMRPHEQSMILIQLTILLPLFLPPATSQVKYPSSQSSQAIWRQTQYGYFMSITRHDNMNSHGPELLARIANCKAFGNSLRS